MSETLKMGRLISQATATLNQATKTLTQIELLFKELRVCIKEEREEKKKNDRF